MPVTSPVWLTVTLVVSDDDHATARSESVTPSALSGATTSCAVEPSDKITDGGPTCTNATVLDVTVSEAWPVFPPIVAMICVVPTPTAITDPVDDTVATPGLLLDQLIVDCGIGIGAPF